MSDTPAGIADILHSIDALGLRGAAVEATVRMFGFALAPRREAAPTVGPPTQADSTDDDAVNAGSVARAEPPDVLAPSARRLEPVRHASTPNAPTVDPLSAGAPLTSHRVPPFAGLFAARDGVEFLRLSASVPIPSDRVDVPAVVSALARGLPLTTVPRIKVSSLGLGAQLLVDVGSSMQPFWEDQQALVERGRHMLRDLADVRYFAQDPGDGAGPERRKGSWRRYEVPLPGTPVIVLSDLGCGFPARSESAQAWVALAERLRRRQCRMVVFAPVRLARLPPTLRHAIEIVLWDRSARRQNLSRLVRALDG